MENFIKVKVGKKEYGFKFTMITLERLAKRSEKEYHELFDYLAGEPFAALNNIFICANAVYNQGEEMSEYEMDEVIDKMSGDQIVQVRDAFRDSLVRMMEKFQSFTSEAKKK